MVQNIAGSPVEGDDFFGRERTIRTLWDLLGNNDILLLGPRRIGKTSLARRLMAEARADGWRAIEVNVASCTDERAFVDKLARSIDDVSASWAAELRNAAASLVGRVRSVRLPGVGGVDLAAAKEETWTDVASDVLALLARQPGHTLVYIDELPIFLSNLVRYDPKTGVERARRFLDWFRNDAREMPGGKGLHWLVSGSVGLDTLVQSHGMADTINSLRHRALEPYSPDEALAFLDALSRSYGLPFSRNEGERLVAAIGWPQPYYLQLAFMNIRTMRREDQPVGEVIDAAVDRLIASGEDNDFHHWEERLRLQLDPGDAEVAVALLTLACRHQGGATASALLAELQSCLPGLSDSQQRQRFFRLRDVLVRDAYWTLDESGDVPRYRFLLQPLRRWWHRRHSL